jgi:uncharacterized protein YdhG (YjbR/CyaY superfamily)
MNSKSASNIDAYISSFPREIQGILTEVRQTIHKAVPDAVEEIKYGMPTFTRNRKSVYFGAFKSHIGFYPTPGTLGAFKEEFDQYKHTKGGVQFPYAKEIPHALIAHMAQFRLQENVK